jgi:hypothetical protein
VFLSPVQINELTGAEEKKGNWRTVLWANDSNNGKLSENNVQVHQDNCIFLAT